MNKSDNIDALANALAKAQERMEAASKDSANPFFKSKYADLTSVTGAIRDAIKGSGLSYIQTSHDCEDSAAIETVILHESGQWISGGIVRVPVSKGDAQGYGSAITYARRYSLSAVFGVTVEDDDGNAATKAKPKEQITPSVGVAETLSLDQRHAMEDLAAEVINRCVAEDFQGAADHIKSFEFTPEEKTFMWGLLASNYRSKLTKLLRA